MLNPRNKNRTSLFRWMVLSAQFPLNTGKLYAFVRLGLVASVSYQHFLLDSTLLRMPSLRGRWSKVEGEEEIQWRESNSSLAHARLILPSQPATLAGHYFVNAINKYLQHSSYVYEKAGLGMSQILRVQGSVIIYRLGGEGSGGFGAKLGRSPL